MANPSHSTASPDPRNPERTSNSVRPEVLSLSKGEGPNGRSDPSTPPAASLRTGFDKLSPNGILDRRTLLTGSAALTGAAAAAAAGAAAGAGLATAAMPGQDPVVAIYRRVLKLQTDRWSPPQLHPNTTVVDEFDAGGFEGVLEELEGASAWGCLSAFELANGDDAEGRALRQVLLLPFEKASGRAALGGSDHGHDIDWRSERRQMP